MLLSILTRKLEREWDFEEVITSRIASCLFAGGIFGTLVLGPLADRWGRKPILLISAIIISVFGLLSAFTQNYMELFPVIFCVGFGVGGLTVPFDILAEFLTTETRGTYLLLIKYFWTLGSMLVPVMAYLTIELADSWRLFAGVSIIPCLLSLVAGMTFVPESPRWLVSQGQNEKALEILRKAAKQNGVDPTTAFPDNVVLADEETQEANFSELLSPRWRKLMLTLSVIWATYCFSFYGTMMTVTRVFDNYDVYDEDDEAQYYAEAAGEDEFDYAAIFLSSASELIGTTLAIKLVESAGRIKTLVGSCVIGAIGTFAMCALDVTNLRWALISCALVARAAQMSMACTAWIVTAELLSTEILSTGHSAVNAIARLGAFFSPYLVDGNFSLLEIGIVLFSIQMVTALSSSTLLETKGVELGKAILIEEARSRDLEEAEYQRMQEGKGVVA